MHAENELLIKVYCAALNPTDWKHAKICWPGYIVGCDFSGRVEAIGRGVKEDFKVGDRVGGVVHGCQSSFRHEECMLTLQIVGKNARTGAMAEYVAADPALCWHMGKHTTFEEASTTGVGLVSATFSLCKLLHYPEAPAESDDTSPASSPEPVCTRS